MSRHDHVSQAIRWCALSMAWAAIVGASAIGAGAAAGAISLVGFGADSIMDGSASAVMMWRFRRERSGRHGGESVERRAARGVGAILILVGLYVAVSAIVALAGHSSPSRSPVGLALTAASLLLLPVLARAKLRLARALSSPGLRGDGILSLAGALLAALTLTSLALTAAAGWWWCDAVAALLIAAFLLGEGGRTINAARTFFRNASYS